MFRRFIYLKTFSWLIYIMSDLENVFEKVVGNHSFHIFNREFLKEKIQYYKMIGENRPDLYLDNFIFNNYDAFEIWCNKNNKSALYPDLKFQVKGYNV